MKWENIHQQQCSVARSLSEIGDRWTMLLVRDAIMGARRFEEYLERSGASRNIVADRLSRLCEAGILESRRYQEKPDRFEYRLTDKGKDLYPVLMSLLAWGDKWLADGHGEPLTLVHKHCGAQTQGQLCCLACGEPLEYGSTHARLRDPEHPYWKPGWHPDTKDA